MEIELDRAQVIGSLRRQRPASSTSGQRGLEEAGVRVRRDMERMYKEVPQPVLDYNMQVERKIPVEFSPKVFRLVSWARSQKDAGRMPQLMDHTTRDHSTKVRKAGKPETVRADLDDPREGSGTARYAG